MKYDEIHWYHKKYNFASVGVKSTVYAEKQRFLGLWGLIWDGRTTFRDGRAKSRNDGRPESSDGRDDGLTKSWFWRDRRTGSHDGRIKYWPAWDGRTTPWWDGKGWSQPHSQQQPCGIHPKYQPGCNWQRSHSCLQVKKIIKNLFPIFTIQWIGLLAEQILRNLPW